MIRRLFGENLFSDMLALASDCFPDSFSLIFIVLAEDDGLE